MRQEPESSARASVLQAKRAELAYLDGLFGCEAGWPLAPIIAWIIEEGRLIAEPASFFTQLCGKLMEAGTPAWRFGLDVATIHPRFAAWQLTWTREGNRVNERRIGHGFCETVAYVGSPAQSIHETGGPFVTDWIVSIPSSITRACSTSRLAAARITSPCRWSSQPAKRISCV